jgi:hypothetical protein
MYSAMNRKEVDFYEEMAKDMAVQFESNLGNMDGIYVVKSLIGEISSSLRTLFSNGYDAGTPLRDYAIKSHKLHLDVSIVIENKRNNKFEIIIFEVKKVKALGLGELSQLIGYCLVSKAKYGILVNVDKNISGEFSTILEGDKDLTKISRIIGSEQIEHKFGVMVWNSETQNMEYTNAGSIKTIPELIELVEKSIS